MIIPTESPAPVIAQELQSELPVWVTSTIAKAEAYEKNQTFWAISTRHHLP